MLASSFLCIGLHHGRFHMHAQVLTDVKRGQLGIHIGIHHRQQIYTGKGKDTQVTEASEMVLLVLEDF